MQIPQEADVPASDAQKSRCRRRSAQFPCEKQFELENVSNAERSLIHETENALPPHLTSQRVDLIQDSLV